MLHIDAEWLRRKIAEDGDEPSGCPYCGALAGCCDDYPNCPEGAQPRRKAVSYSFNVRRSTKEEAIAGVIAEMDKVVASQPIHATDRDPTIETAKAFVNMIPEDTSKDVQVNVSGSVSWSGTYPDSHTVVGANVSVSTSLWNRETAAA